MKSNPIVFIRHGESEANVYLHTNDPDATVHINRLGDPLLSDIGKQQSVCTGKKLCLFSLKISNVVVKENLL